MAGWDKPDEPIEVKGTLAVAGNVPIGGPPHADAHGALRSGTAAVFFEHTSRQQPVYFPFAYEDSDDTNGSAAPDIAAWKQFLFLRTLTRRRLALRNFWKQEGDTIHFQRKLVVGGISSGGILWRHSQIFWHRKGR